VKVATPSADRAVRHQRAGSRLTPAGAALVLAIVMLSFAMMVPVRTLMHQRSDLARLQKEERLLSQRNAALSRQIARLNDPAYLDRIARECLGMTKPGEISFVVVPRGGSNGGSQDPTNGGLADLPQHSC
jgi:cell division protein FtsB